MAKCAVFAPTVESQNWYAAMCASSASVTDNSVAAPTVSLSASLTFPPVTTGLASTGAVTWNSCHAPQSVPSFARTHKSSAPEPDWNVGCASCAAVTSIATLVVCATPSTTQCPLAGSAVESQNWYLM